MTAIPMSEEDLQTTVIDMCRALGLLVAHFRPAQIRPGKWVTAVQGDGAGFPDLVAVGPGGVLFRELKAEGKYPTRQQRIWINRLGDAGADVRVWWPSHLRGGDIEADLKRLAKPRTEAA
jgi:hypothetical protein